MVAAVSFFSSFVLLVAFGTLRFWELGREKRLLAAFRADLDVRVARFYRALATEELSTLWRRTLTVFVNAVTHRTVLMLVEVLRAVEKPLSRLSLKMRMHKLSPNGTDVSPYLKSIVPGKKESAGDGTTPSSEV